MILFAEKWVRKPDSEGIPSCVGRKRGHRIPDSV